MKCALLLLVLFALAAVSQCQEVQREHPRILQTMDKPLNKCRVAYRQLLGNPSTVATATTERTCFYSCDVKSASWYTWNLQTQTCQCFSYANISGVQPTPPPSVTPSFDYFVYGNIQACFPFCSVAVDKCQRCNVKNGNLTCVFNYSRRRCCCVPPATPVIKRGLLTGCTQFPELNPRQTLEIRRQALESIDPLYQVMSFDTIGYAGHSASVGVNVLDGVGQ